MSSSGTPNCIQHTRTGISDTLNFLFLKPYSLMKSRTTLQAPCLSTGINHWKRWVDRKAFRTPWITSLAGALGRLGRFDMCRAYEAGLRRHMFKDWSPLKQEGLKSGLTTAALRWKTRIGTCYPVEGPGLAWRVVRLIWQIQFLVFYILIQYYMYVPAHNRVSNMPLVADGE